MKRLAGKDLTGNLINVRRAGEVDELQQAVNLQTQQGGRTR